MTFTLDSTAVPVYPRYQVPVCPPEHALHFRVYQPNPKSVNCFKPNYFKPLPFSFKLSLKNCLFCSPKRVDILIFTDNILSSRNDFGFNLLPIGSKEMTRFLSETSFHISLLTNFSKIYFENKSSVVYSLASRF